MGLSLEDAMKVVQMGMSKAQGLNLKVSIAVVDEEGYLVVLERMDGASWMSPKISESKAKASSAFKKAGSELLQMAQATPVFWSGVSSLTQGELVFGKGGAPIKKGGSHCGGVGVSGGTGDQDEVIALEAAKAVG
jgi:uncharacterized protein GlcG (DUF336 family)